MNETLTQTGNAIQTLLTASRRIKRGKDGRVEGVEVVGPDGVIASQKVIRGPDGRIEGVQ